MSFSFSASGPAFAVKGRLAADKTVHAGVKAFVSAGIDSLVVRHGPAVRVGASAQGHSHNGKPGNSETTSANVKVDVLKKGA